MKRASLCGFVVLLVVFMGHATALAVDATLKIYFRDSTAISTPLAGVEVQGESAPGQPFDPPYISDATGLVTIKRPTGTWTFQASKDGYTTPFGYTPDWSWVINGDQSRTVYLDPAAAGPGPPVNPGVAKKNSEAKAATAYQAAIVLAKMNKIADAKVALDRVATDFAGTQGALDALMKLARIQVVEGNSAGAYATVVRYKVAKRETEQVPVRTGAKLDELKADAMATVAQADADIAPGTKVQQLTTAKTQYQSIIATFPNTDAAKQAPKKIDQLNTQIAKATAAAAAKADKQAAKAAKKAAKNP